MESFALAALLIILTDVNYAVPKFKSGSVLCPNLIPNRAWINIPRKAVTLLTKVFNADLKWQHNPAEWEDARVTPAHPSCVYWRQ